MNRIDQGRLERSEGPGFAKEPTSSLRRLGVADPAVRLPEAGNDARTSRKARAPRPGKGEARSPDGKPVKERLPDSADALQKPAPDTPAVPEPESTKPEDGAAARGKPRRRKIRGNRGVDTLLRNSYRAQLDMLALAATKANIMISLNGLLMSLMMLSGSHFLSLNPLNAIPMGLFLIGCATATVFAVLAARPEVSQRTFEQEDFESDQARLLVFEEFSDLEETQYIDSMSRLLRDPGRVYRSMLAHVHEMGRTADKKYQRLYYSYTVFMIGFVLAAAALGVVQILDWLPGASTAA